jgi:hypothetical protein
MGSVGLAAFAYVVYKGLPLTNAAIVLPVASFVWLLAAFAIWKTRKLMRRF